MRRKTVSGIMLSLLLIGMLILTFNIQPVKASGTIYIGSDYTFTSNIYEPIVVTANNIVIDGNGYTLQGTGSGTGIDLFGRSNVTIKKIEMKYFDTGIYLRCSSNNTISGNNITNNDYGIWLSCSENNTLRNNDASNNTYNFGVSGTSLSHYIQDIDDSNTVNGKPIYYWVNRQDMDIPLDAGYVALVNCTRITAKNLNLTNNMQAVLTAFTTNSIITKNNITNNGRGIELTTFSNHNSISGNNITKNEWQGMYLCESSNNNISGNNIINSEYGMCAIINSNNNILLENNIANHSTFGIGIDRSENGIIEANNITSSLCGIFLNYASNHTFFHNNFVNNTHQVHGDSENTWDNGYPSGGNYWSDYSGVDLYSGPYQNETGSDRIGDTPYDIDQNNRDNYPLMNPWTDVFLLSDLDQDGFVTIADISIAAIAFGSFPSHPRWIPMADLDMDGVVTISDIAKIAVNFGKTV